ncbi:MAG: alpha-glucosidase, partial [Cellulomonadaceae bacterium]|nr:alpha-glucosidase [Cellulomonadaceae bacterium]
DYLRDLGIDALWLSPIYDSPNDDNGYDIRNYRAIMAEFGSMEDFDRLLAGLHARGMRLIMDLVVNHTSDEHEWFQQALTDPASPYRDYYIFRDGNPATPPNNWTSFFSGPAWRWFPDGLNSAGQPGVWALHLFSPKQMDLNWECAALRASVVDMVDWWLSKGVDGFRLDVINYISKQPGLPDGDATIGNLMGFTGVENYYYGPRLHEYLHQLKVEAFEPHGAFSVGETPGIGIEMAALLTAAPRRELDLIFNFDQLETPGHARFDRYRYDLNYLARYLTDWTLGYPDSCWMSLFYNNHDNPRMISKINPDPAVRAPLAKLLALIQLTSQGTPFIFQGDEIGMVNQTFTDMSQLRDVESLNLYRELIADGHSPADAFATVLAGSRDHARVPMQWHGGDHAGFSQVTPWIVGDGDQRWCNVATQLGQADSVLAFYRRLIALRRDTPALVDGDVRFVASGAKNYFAYVRGSGSQRYAVEGNLSATPLKRPVAAPQGQLLASTYPDSDRPAGAHGSQSLRPYEAAMYRLGQ